MAHSGCSRTLILHRGGKADDQVLLQGADQSVDEVVEPMNFRFSSRVQYLNRLQFELVAGGLRRGISSARGGCHPG